MTENPEEKPEHVWDEDGAIELFLLQTDFLQVKERGNPDQDQQVYLWWPLSPTHVQERQEDQETECIPDIHIPQHQSWSQPASKH